MSQKHFLPKSVIKTSRAEIDIPLEVREQAAHGSNNDLLPFNALPVIDLPAGLYGYIFIAGPLFQEEGNPAEDGTQLYTGDGMMYRLGFDQGVARLKTRIAKPPCYYADLATQFYLSNELKKVGLEQPSKALSKFVSKHKLFSLFAAFRNGGPSRYSIILGSRNLLNTAFLKTRDSLLTTMDAGQPYVVDTDSMELVQAISNAQEWRGFFPLISKLTWLNIFDTYMNSAHPGTDVNTIIDDRDYFFSINYSTGYNGIFRSFIQPILNNKVFQKVIQLLCSWRGQTFNPNEDFGRFTYLIRYQFAKASSNTDEVFERWRLLLENGDPVTAEQSLHQIAITEDYIVIADIAFKMKFSQIFSPFFFGYLKVWQSGIWHKIGCFIYHHFLNQVRPLSFGQIYMIKRRDIISDRANIYVKQLKLPREISHFTADYSNPDGKVTLHVAHPIGWDVTEWITEYDQPIPDKPALRNDLQGMIVGTTDLGLLGKYVVDGETGQLENAHQISDIKSTWSLSVYTHRNLKRDIKSETSSEVKNIYWLSLGFSWELIPHRIYEEYKSKNRTIPVGELPRGNKPISIIRLDTATMTIADTYAFPVGVHVSAIQFVPNAIASPNSIDPSMDGFIVCIVLSDLGDEFWIFHADDFNRKPVYRLRQANPEPRINIAMTIHSTWVPHLTKDYADADYRAKVRAKSYEADYAAVIDRKGKAIQELFNDYVKPHFIAHTSEQDYKAEITQ